MPINTEVRRESNPAIQMVWTPFHWFHPLAPSPGRLACGWLASSPKKQEIQKSILWRVMADTFFRKFGLEMKLSRTAIVNISIRNRENFNKKLANMWGEKSEIRTKKSTCRFLWKLIFSPHVNPSQFLTRVWISSQIENWGGVYKVVGWGLFYIENQFLAVTGVK